MSRDTKYGSQPAKNIIWDAGFSLSELAEKLDVQPTSHLRSAVNGVCPPTKELRDKLPAFLGRKLEDLFEPEVLAARYSPRKKQESDAEKYDARSMPLARARFIVDTRSQRGDEFLRSLDLDASFMNLGI